MTTSTKIDFVSDVSCPWCAIGLQSLLAALPVVGGRRVTDDFWLEGEPPNPGDLPTGCRFRTRCPRAEARCAEQEPEARMLADGRRVACHFP